MYLVIFFLQFLKYKLKKALMVCLGFNPGPQDGRLRQNHGAIAATKLYYWSHHN